MIKTPISARIQKILDTPYKFTGKHAEFIQAFTYKQESKYRVTPYEDYLLRIKFNQLPQGSEWEEQGRDENGRTTTIERNKEMEIFG
jgi:hypothetical protein